MRAVNGDSTTIRNGLLFQKSHEKLITLLSVMKRVYILILLLGSLGCCQSVLHAQTYVMTDCLEAFNIDLPLNFGEFEQGDSLNLSDMPVLRYLRADQYTLWYRFEAQESGTLQYAVWTTNRVDRFQSVLYEYNGDTFCRDLVDGNAVIMQSVRSEHLTDSDKHVSPIITNQLEVTKGQTFYLSVLSLNPEYCGHLLALEFNDIRIRIHAMNKPCYNFAAIDFELEETPESIKALDNTMLEIELHDPSLIPVIESSESEASEPELLEEESIDALQPISIAPTASPSALKEMKPVAGDKVRLEEVYFYNNTFAFREDSESQLEDLYRFLESNPSVQIEIGGHTSGNTANIRPDPNFRKRGKGWRFKGSSEKLSQKRAEAVKDYLEGRGVAAGRMETHGYGNTQRIVARPQNPEEHRKNMRVEITVISVD